MDAVWRIEMLGWLRATHGDCVVSRFRTRKTAALLAYLALSAHCSHPRDLLVELLWPESEPDAARTSLRVALASLRRQLEPPGVPHGTVLLSDRATVQLNPAAIVTDVAQFEVARDGAARAGSEAERMARLTEAASLYRGELLPGCYESWALPERARLAEAYLHVLGQFACCLEQAGELPRALEVARRAVAADPLREEAHQDLIRMLKATASDHRQPALAAGAHQDLIRMLKATGQHEAARRQAQELEQLLADDLAALRSAVALPAPLVARPGSPDARRQEAPSSPSAAPPERTESVREGYLPLPLTRFFGRERELESLRELLLTADTRLVTLTGPGGSGKTRLALEVAARLCEPLAGAVWFVPLVDLADPRRVAEQVRDALRVSRAPEAEPLEQLVAFLSRQPSLLLLDNFEHLVDEGAAVVQALLEQVAGLTVLVTSRRRLDLPGERDFPVTPLPTPEVMAAAAVRSPEEQQKEREGLERLLECPSVRLFVDRAQAARPDYQLRPGNAAAVAALCARLEGLPLALELAAARSGVLTPAQMLARLEDRFALLARSGRTEGRHRSLRAALDWSYQLLSPELQRFFARLSVFGGGWTLAAAEAVCDEPRAMDYLEQLRECSLVVAQEEGEEIRFRLLETIREYGQQRLEESGDEDAVQRRHAEFFLAVAQQGTEKSSREWWAWLDRIETEHDNLRVALERCQATVDHADVSLRMAAALWQFWGARGHWSEGQDRLAKVLSQAGEPSPARACALNGAGVLASRRGDFAVARSFLEESLASYRQFGDQVSVAGLLNNLGAVALNQSDYGIGQRLFEEALAISRALGNRPAQLAPLYNLGGIAMANGNDAEAETFYEAAYAIVRQGGMRGGPAFAARGRIAMRRGDFELAEQIFAENLGAMREFKNKVEIARSLHSLGQVSCHQRKYRVARAFYQESLTLRRELGEKRGIAASLQEMAVLAMVERQPARAARLFGAAAALRDVIGAPLPPVEAIEAERHMTTVRATMSEEAFATAWAEGQAMPLQHAIEYALMDE